MTTRRQLGRCVDCAPDAPARKVSKPGPRCASCHRSRRAAASRRRHDAHLRKTYGITREDYEAILESQDYKCAICRRTIGVTRNGCVDHDHSKTGRESVRGILDQRCNYYVLGHLGDSCESLLRAVQYLEDPPAQAVLRKRRGL